MPDQRWHELFPDRVRLLRRYYFKNMGVYVVTAPADAETNIIRISAVGVGAQGENPGACGAFSHSLRPCAPLEKFQLQVGQTETGMTAGDSWLRRLSNGEMLCYADRGKGTYGPGQAGASIGDIRRSGSYALSGSDAGDKARLGFGGRAAAAGQSQLRAPGPGGGGWIAPIWPNPAKNLGGQGQVAVEFYAGHPGPGY